MNRSEIQQALRDIGWPITVDGNIGPQSRSAIWEFQAGWSFSELAVDANAGDLTQRALHQCLDNGGKCSAYFTFREFRSKGDGWIKIDRTHAWRLDRYREQVGPVSIVSGYRDPAHNTRVGGARNSQHLYGTASDIPGVRSQGHVRAMGLFTGIGTVRATGLVVHVDSRPGDPASPTLWWYG